MISDELEGGFRTNDQTSKGASQCPMSEELSLSLDCFSVGTFYSSLTEVMIVDISATTLKL